MRKILIVEDELVVRTIYRRKFEMSGYAVETAEDGAVAMKVLPVFNPDVIQLDIMMPGVDGVEVIRQIRAWPDYQHVPILVLSSFYRPDMAKEAWKAGANKCVSKLDCTPNLALELVEQLLSGEPSGFTPRFGVIPLPKGALDLPAPPPATPEPKPEATLGKASPSAETDTPKLTVKLDLPPKTSSAPTLPTFSQTATAPAVPLKPSNRPMASDKPVRKESTRPTLSRPNLKTSAAERVQEKAEPNRIVLGDEPEPEASSGPDFRTEIRSDFLKRAPQIQTELRMRVAALMKSNSVGDQLRLLGELEGSVSSLASLAGITGFARVSHISGALDTLIKDLRGKPNHMTNSVLRTIAHAMDCLNSLFLGLGQTQQEIPQSGLILAVDDEPISRRTISIALSKANLRCIALEDPHMALTILNENPFDLIFLDADMPGLDGFQVCEQVRKMPTNQNTPVIFVTSLTRFEVRAKSSLSGGDDLIAKPFQMMELAVKALTYLLRPQPSVQAEVRPMSVVK